MTENSAEEPRTGWFSEEAATFGDRMAAARDAGGMTQAALARRLGVKLKTVEAWENDVAEPRANKLQMLSGLLNVSLRWLMTGEGDGLDHPPADAVLAADAREILADLRQVRAEMTRLGDTLGGLEKRLRAVVKEGL
ncbi:helix-turn-helix domain-containing protein [Roseicitreum antarcticum]|uniref:Transcriptional regulator, contains XRE-family HTH domain n=1 Tax=Roseicitreum antarcticum TaxID=564137 RepID=A0A1H3BTN1_9RHOB|nr:helix-turn-helix domain-containing protein [Roseicitreum antarcticum]SDX45360.1 Transcriptional regulator, contains XRE-family HTH domain [Roseicitreum antarcticum]